MELLTVAEFSRLNKVSETAIRKNKSLDKIEFKGQMYIVSNMNSQDKHQFEIEQLKAQHKHEIKLKNALISKLKAQVQANRRIEEFETSLKEDKIKLENRIKELEEKWTEATNKKEEIFEKFINESLKLSHQKTKDNTIYEPPII